MHDHTTPGAADSIEVLLDQLDAGDPFAEEVERMLNETGGPVTVIDDDIAAAGASVRQRLQPEAPQSVQPRSRWPWGLAIAAAALLAVGSWELLTAPTPPQSADVQVAISVPEPDLTGIEIKSGSMLAVRADTLVLTNGAVTIDHGPNNLDAVHRVRLPQLGVDVEPVGTLYHAGTHGSVGAVWVREGRVRLVHDLQGHLGEVGAGGWAILVRHPDDEGIEVHRIADGPFDPTDLGLTDSGIAQLMADMRWMALPADARTQILGDVVAP